MRFGLEKIRDFRELLRTLAVGLQRLSFEDNFEQQLVENITIPAGSEVSIRNSLNFVPTKAIILFQRGNGNVTSGVTNNDKNFVYLYNHGPSEVEVSVSFQR